MQLQKKFLGELRGVARVGGRYSKGTRKIYRKLKVLQLAKGPKKIFLVISLIV